MIDRVQIVSVPVSDQKRAKDFYLNSLGFELQQEIPFGDGMRWIEVAPEGSTASLTLVTWFEAMPPGSLQGLVVATDDIRATHEESCSPEASPSIFLPQRCPAGPRRSSATPTATAWCSGSGNSQRRKDRGGSRSQVPEPSDVPERTRSQRASRCGSPERTARCTLGLLAPSRSVEQTLLSSSRGLRRRFYPRSDLTVVSTPGRSSLWYTM